MGAKATVPATAVRVMPITPLSNWSPQGSPSLLPSQHEARTSLAHQQIYTRRVLSKGLADPSQPPPRQTRLSRRLGSGGPHRGNGAPSGAAATPADPATGKAA
ncbi:hypothetical protein GCM10009637_24820 [Brevibacterium luteolum]